MNRLRDAVILGSGRSGTSMVAGTVAAAGYFLGNDLYPAREANPKGFFECPEVNGVNEYLLASVLPPSTALAPNQRWLVDAPPGLEFDVPPALAARMARLTARRPWCFKDPRFSFTLPAWRPVLGDAVHVCVFRDPATTAASIVRECREQPYLQGVVMDTERALAVWQAMYREILDRHRHDGEWLFVHYDAALEPGGLAPVERALGVRLDADFPDAALARSRPTADVPTPLHDTYAQLCELAGRAVAPRATRPAAAVPLAEHPELSVVLCTYDRADRLAACLDRLAAQTAAPHRFEVVIVDDGSTDGTAALLDGLTLPVPHRVVHRENGGLAAARNSGIAAARGDLLLFLDDDVLAAPDLIERHLAAHSALGRPASVLGTLEPPPGALASGLPRWIEAAGAVFRYGDLVDGATYDWTRFWTGNVSVPAADVARAGGFDETFRRYGCEDTDLGIRLDALGVPVVYAAAARAEHDHVHDLDGLKARQAVVAEALVRFFVKHPAAVRHPDMAWTLAHDLTSLDRHVVDRLPHAATWEATARALASIDLRGLEAAGDAVAAPVRQALAAVMQPLHDLWWLEGLADALRTFGLSSFAELAGTPPEKDDETLRLLAWPSWSSPADLVALADSARVLAEVVPTWFWLRHDPDVDVPLPSALAALEQACAGRLPDGAPVEWLIVGDPIGPGELPRLGASVHGSLPLPASASPRRASFLRDVGAPTVPDARQLAVALRADAG